MLRFDRVLALSEWHKSHLLEVYPMLDAGKVVVTRNGVDLSRFEPVPPTIVDHDWLEEPLRNPHRAIYSSSPDRGLMLALELWPRIRERVPDAELHIYYGFENWEKAARLNPDYASAFGGLETIELMREKMKQPGVVYHGRVNQQELARAFLGAGVWFYPTWFSETSCITAMEAQAAGCSPITSTVAALAETVRIGHVWGPCSGDWYGDKDHRDWCVAQTVLAMTKTQEFERQAIAEEARGAFGLDTLASDWSTLFTDLLAEVEANPVAPYVAWRATG